MLHLLNVYVNLTKLFVRLLDQVVHILFCLCFEFVDFFSKSFNELGMGRTVGLFTPFHFAIDRAQLVSGLENFVNVVGGDLVDDLDSLLHRRRYVYP